MNISFIIPAYNCAATLSEAVASVYDDNFSEGDEVIIVNDASTDNTASVIKELQLQYPAITTFHHNINKGSAGAARNTGVDNATNELLFCLDADNILIEGSIKRLKEYFIIQKADAAAFGEIHFFIDKSRKISHKWILNDEISLLDNINSPHSTPCSTGNYLFTKESWKRVGRYAENIGGAYDSWAFGTMQLATGSKMITLPGTFYLHRHGYESTFVKDSKKRNTSLTILQVLLPIIDIFDTDDVNYITSEKGRYCWFEEINKRPLRLRKENTKTFFRSFKLVK
jgi:glycosyltransferase involved in cell wall biosynthesis